MKRNVSIPAELFRSVGVWQRELHEIPELGFQEHKTTAYLKNVLSGLEGVTIQTPTATGLVAEIKGGQAGKTVAYRADIDALPITEDESHPVRSLHAGVMHACGHDGHMAMALGAAAYLSSIRQQLQGNVRFLFQPAEECPPGGAEQLIAAGALEGVSAIIGCHLESKGNTGNVYITHGAMLAATSTFSIRIIGRGGHAASPHQTVDPIMAGVDVVSALQTIVSRRKDPLHRVVVSVTQFHGGTADNIIPGEVRIGGTVRILDDGPGYDTLIPRWMEEIIKGVCAAYGASYAFTYERDYGRLENHEAITQMVEAAAVETVGAEHVCAGVPNMAGDDMGNYLRHIPGCYYVIGCKLVEDGEVYPNHHAKFQIHPDALATGTEVAVQAIMKLLEE